jgi:hypothetical protein
VPLHELHAGTHLETVHEVQGQDEGDRGDREPDRLVQGLGLAAAKGDGHRPRHGQQDEQAQHVVGEEAHGQRR